MRPLKGIVVRRRWIPEDMHNEKDKSFTPRGVRCCDFFALCCLGVTRARRENNLL